MPTELEELVGFITHQNPQIRLLATENLVPYSLSDPSIFKVDDMRPIKNLKVLLNDHYKVAEYALSCLINLSGDPEVLECLASDDKFLDLVLSFIVLMDLLVKGQNGSYNPKADFDYLAYVLADLSKHEDIRKYFVTEQTYDKVIPITKLKVFTEHESDIRRKGVASTLKNVAFNLDSHPSFLSTEGIDILPYILLPITGNEEYDVDETMSMLPDLQLLPPDKKRDSDNTIIQTHLETLLLLTTTRPGRDYLRQVNVYPVVRETHSRVDDDEVREACDRLVQVLMRDEEGEGQQLDQKRLTELADDEEEITEV
ncbi:Protein HGH1 [Beauveria bassiana]|nr:Protein HGH1 [Beauveria bassiana]